MQTIMPRLHESGHSLCIYILVHIRIDKKRSDEDLAELDSKNKITKEIVRNML